jgi:hypothetical protein
MFAMVANGLSVSTGFRAALVNVGLRSVVRKAVQCRKCLGIVVTMGFLGSMGEVYGTGGWPVDSRHLSMVGIPGSRPVRAGNEAGGRHVIGPSSNVEEAAQEWECLA